MDRKNHTAARAKIEFGDFQTPPPLAHRIARLLLRSRFRPQTVLEPTCGQGSLLLAAADAFPRAVHVAGIDVNPNYLRDLDRIVQRRVDRARFQLRCDNILQFAAEATLVGMPEPWLVVGNPPWVTSSALGALESTNLPAKSNLDARQGLDAITGQANFDVSEWILRRIVSWLEGHEGTMAMLCKTSVARKILAYVWRQQLPMRSARMYLIDAVQEFAAAVDACLLVCDFHPSGANMDADIYASLESSESSSRIGWRSGKLVADIGHFDRWKHLSSAKESERYKWRSGVKHDCAPVLELERENGKLCNRLGELVDIEARYVYPLLKSSDLVHDISPKPRRWLLLPQRQLGDDTVKISHRAPRTWQYLLAYADRLDRRRSSIYRHRPRFAVFGVIGPAIMLPDVAFQPPYISLFFVR